MRRKATPLILIILAAAACAACKKNGDNTANYNGFKVNGTVYTLDSIEHDYDLTLRPVTIYSKANGGARLYFHLGYNEHPSADGVYQYKLKAVIHDSLDASACFEPEDSTFSTYCTVEGPSGQSLATLTITISGGKWSITAPVITVVDNSAKTLEIQAHE